MADREKVIKALELCSDALYCADPSSRCSQCPYRTKDMTGTDERNCSDILMADALALLKEQETVEHAKEVLCKNGWEKMRYPSGTIGKWDDPEIVRCKDCKHCDTDTLEHCWCMILARSREPDWFCADGKRKDT